MKVCVRNFYALDHNTPAQLIPFVLIFCPHSRFSGVIGVAGVTLQEKTLSRQTNVMAWQA